jgi:IS5 family transposase
MDVVIEEGNPADSRRLLPMIKRIQADYGKLPRQVAADEGYARKGNISEAKSLGIKVVGLTRSTA